MALGKINLKPPHLYIKLRVIAAEIICTFLHFGISGIKIFLPEGVSNKFKICNSGFIFNETYYCLSNAGLFSIISTIYTDITEANVPIRKISTVFGAILYKKYFFQNIWNAIFETPGQASVIRKSPECSALPPAVGWWSTDYHLLPLSSIYASTTVHFYPSRLVFSKKMELLKKYQISPSKTIALHYRGTDKVREIANISLGTIKSEIDKFLIKYPDSRILLQVDEKFILESLISTYSEVAFYFSELPTSEGSTGAHYLSKLDPVLDAVTYFASVLILSECRALITHTGNGALWEAIFRSSSENLKQLRGA
jgi:hypothetical protein